MKAKSIYNYLSYNEFLKDYYSYRNGKNPHFNYSVWAGKLKFSNVAILTRILNGDRHPGSQVLTSLTEYFQFSPDEQEYFETLVRYAKEKDSALQELIKKRILDIRENKCPISPLLNLHARNLIVWGTAQPQRFQEYLSEFGFESLLGYATSSNSICLNGATVFQSEIGVFDQFSFACYAKRKSHPLAASEMFFAKLYASKAEVVEQYQNCGSPYELAAMNSNLEPDHSLKSFQLGAERASILNLQMGESKKQTLQADQPNDVFGYNAKLGIDRAFRMSFKSTAYCREFDAEVDTCSWQPQSELGKILQQIQFEPKLWTYQPHFNVAIFPHEAR